MTTTREYAGFWLRCGGAIIGCVAFWIARSATPGKIVLGMRIIDAETGGKPTNMQFVIRLIGSLLSALLLGLGYLWAAVDDRKQTLHDRIAGTLVVREVRNEALAPAP